MKSFQDFLHVSDFLQLNMIHADAASAPNSLCSFRTTLFRGDSPPVHSCVCMPIHNDTDTHQTMSRNSKSEKEEAPSASIHLPIHVNTFPDCILWDPGNTSHGDPQPSCLSSAWQINTLSYAPSWVSTAMQSSGQGPQSPP